MFKPEQLQEYCKWRKYVRDCCHRFTVRLRLTFLLFLSFYIYAYNLQPFPICKKKILKLRIYFRHTVWFLNEGSASSNNSTYKLKLKRRKNSNNIHTLGRLKPMILVFEILKAVFPTGLLPRHELIRLVEYNLYNFMSQWKISSNLRRLNRIKKSENITITPTLCLLFEIYDAFNLWNPRKCLFLSPLVVLLISWRKCGMWNYKK
jgi:hypothetical protein